MHWHPAGPAVSRFFDNLSILFPDGERFFIASVKAHRHLVEDEKLRADMKAFYAQEGHHGREHLRYNQWLRDQDLGVERMEDEVRAILALARDNLPPRQQLAVTCALEHLTALLADIVLTDDAILAGADPDLAALWRWHAAEESEHKAVAFDVYQAVGGTYRERCVIMVSALTIFVRVVLRQQWRLMRREGLAWSPRAWWGLTRFLWIEPGGLASALPRLLAYFRRDFHPWDLDNAPLVEQTLRDLDAAA